MTQGGRLLLRFASFFAVLCLTISCAAKPKAVSRDYPPPRQDAETIVAVVYNIRAAKGMPGAPGATIPQRLDAIAALLSGAQADLVLLQEVDRGTSRAGGLDLAEELRARLGFAEARFAEAIPLQGGAYGVAVLSRWPILESDQIPLPIVTYDNAEVPGYFSEPRVVQHVVVQTPGGELSVFNTHLGLTGEQRLLQTEAIAGAIDDLGNRRPLVLGGDLNAEPGSTELIPLRLRLRDAYHGFRRENGLWADLPIAERLTYPADKPVRCIDYLFTSPSIAVVKTAVLAEPALSDHRPLRVTFQLPR